MHENESVHPPIMILVLSIYTIPAAKMARSQTSWDDFCCILAETRSFLLMSIYTRNEVYCILNESLHITMGMCQDPVASK